MLSRLFGQPEEEVRAQATVWGDWPGDVTSGQSVSVNQHTSMQLLAVSGCVRLITDSIATLPVDTFREDAQGVRTEIEPPRWLKMPTVDLDFTAWCTQVLTSLLLHGNAYCSVTRSGSQIVELIPVDPSLVTPAMVKGRKVFLVAGREFPGEILHIPAMMLPGAVKGLSPLEYAATTIGLGLAAQNFAKGQFETSLNMPGVIEYPNRAVPDPQSVAKMWRRNRSKGGQGLPGVLEGGGTWKPTGISNEAAQFLQARQWGAAEIAAQVYMVDPSDLGIPVGGTTLTYANLEQRNIRRVQVTFLPWIVRLEKALSALLPQPRYVKMNVDALLRADSATRWANYKTGFEINTLAQQVGQGIVLQSTEVRDWEDLNYIEEYPSPPPIPAATQMNSAQPLNITVNTPDMRSEAPVVNVTNDVHVPEQRTPQVTVEPAAVVVDVAPVTVNVPGADVRVNIPEQETRTTVRTIERDADGRITRLIDEVN
jgi:HK97 family phage portal protein